MATAVSACFVRAGRVGGAEHAFYNLLDGLRTVVPPDGPWSVVTAEPLATGFALAPLIEHRLRVGRVRNRVAIESRALPFVRDVDRWLLPNYYTPLGLRGRVVTVIHDAQYAHYPENFSVAKRRWLAAAHRYTMRRADVVVAISQFVATDLLHLHGQRFGRKVQVIPNAVSFSRLDGGALPPGVPLEREIVLCVAAAYRHKNLPTLVRAFAELRKRRDSAHLVLVGQSAEQLIGARTSVEVGSLVHELGLDSHVTSLAYVSDPELGALYRAAAVLAMPSLFEGFGLPVVEALGLGVPVVSTRAGALVEVSLGFAHYVDDPMSAQAMAAALADVLGQGGSGRPSAADVDQVRARYAPATVARLAYNAVQG
jgi:glycosyltransferase involved in cell wall biosynthesis